MDAIGIERKYQPFVLRRVMDEFYSRALLEAQRRANALASKRGYDRERGEFFTVIDNLERLSDDHYWQDEMHLTPKGFTLAAEGFEDILG